MAKDVTFTMMVTQKFYSMLTAVADELATSRASILRQSFLYWYKENFPTDERNKSILERVAAEEEMLDEEERIATAVSSKLEDWSEKVIKEHGSLRSVRACPLCKTKDGTVLRSPFKIYCPKCQKEVTLPADEKIT